VTGLDCPRCKKWMGSTHFRVLYVESKPDLEQGTRIGIECPECGKIYTVTGYGEWETEEETR
tara:strand:- start:138 stop:323 length:186 start_codon:yes stop_codon:yes gene_type:complete